jgi:hypothetical protein
MRVVREDSGKVGLQVALRKFESNGGHGPAVWLVGAMHIGEPSYYQALQNRLNQFDIVLYEGVNTGSHKRHAGKPDEAIEKPLDLGKTEKEKKSDYNVQSKLASALGLVFQLEAIDYDRTNFFNSDLSVADIQRIMADGAKNSGGVSAGGGQSFEQLLHIMDGKSFLGTLVKFGIEFIASSPKLQALTKFTFIETIGRLKGDLSDMQSLPPDIKNLVKVLIEARNKKVIADLKDEIQSMKKRNGTVAIFYGAGHMDNMEKLLASELGYFASNEDWMNVFAVDLKKSGVTEGEANATRAMVDWQLNGLQGK